MARSSPLHMTLPNAEMPFSIENESSWLITQPIEVPPFVAYFAALEAAIVPLLLFDLDRTTVLEVVAKDTMILLIPICCASALLDKALSSGEEWSILQQVTNAV